jgi:hypothetical protein
MVVLAPWGTYVTPPIWMVGVNDWGAGDMDGVGTGEGVVDTLAEGVVSSRGRVEAAVCADAALGL